MWSHLVLLSLALAPHLDDVDRQKALRAEVADALKRYYEERLHRPFLRNPDEPEKKPVPPPWDAPLKKLKSGKPDEKADAVAFLQELLSQALEDETSEKAPWRSTPYWGGGAEIPARDLRKEIADELAKAAPLEESLPLIGWYLRKETIPGHLLPVVEALGKLDSKEAEALRVELAISGCQRTDEGSDRAHPGTSLDKDRVRQGHDPLPRRQERRERERRAPRLDAQTRQRFGCPLPPLRFHADDPRRRTHQDHAERAHPERGKKLADRRNAESGGRTGQD